MAQQQARQPTVEQADARPAENSVALSGRVSSAPVERELPSGDRILTFRLVVDRGASPMAGRSRQTTDWVDCVVWGGRARRTVRSWQVGDVVAVAGAIRRRFFRAEGRPASRVEVEVLGARRVRRAA